MCCAKKENRREFLSIDQEAKRIYSSLFSFLFSFFFDPSTESNCSKARVSWELHLFCTFLTLLYLLCKQLEWLKLVTFLFNGNTGLIGFVVGMDVFETFETSEFLISHQHITISTEVHFGGLVIIQQGFLSSFGFVTIRTPFVFLKKKKASLL